MNCRIVSCLAILILSAVFTLSLSAQDFCDSTLQQVENNPLSYHTIGNRCEGVYVQPLGSTSLQVVSFTEFFENYDLTSSKPLQVDWETPTGSTSVHLRAQGIKRKLYYRMDASSAPDKPFSWPVNVLASLNIEKNDIGVVALTKDSVLGKQKDIYVPVRISQNATEGSRNSNYTITVLPGLEISEIYISIAQPEIDGRPERMIKKKEKLGYGYYPADRSIDIPISGIQERGVYRMQIDATLRNGNSTSIEIWFFIPGR